MPVPWPLAPASFAGTHFYVAMHAGHRGRRIVPFEFPKNDIPDTEDMGRRIRRWSITGYILYSPVLDPAWQASRDELINTLEADDLVGTLIMPTGLVQQVRVDRFSVTEWQEKGGYCEFQMEFIEAGQSPFSSPLIDTVSTLLGIASTAVLAFQNSSDITDF